MRTDVSLALLLAILLPLSNAYCSYTSLEPGATECFDKVDNKWHPDGSVWLNSNCMRCTCTGCCTAFGTPSVFPDDCVSVFDQKACKYNVHKKDDPSIECPVFVSVG